MHKSKLYTLVRPAIMLINADFRTNERYEGCFLFFCIILLRTYYLINALPIQLQAEKPTQILYTFTEIRLNIPFPD